MKVILLQDIKGVGKKGQIIDAADGYAANFLLPRKMAMEASKGNLTNLENKKKSEEAKRVKDLEQARELKGELESKTVKIAVKTGEQGRLFGSITNKEVAAALLEQEGIEIDKKKISINEPIKTLGTYKADLKLHSDISVKLNLDVVPVQEK